MSRHREGRVRADFVRRFLRRCDLNRGKNKAKNKAPKFMGALIYS
jgi:hypothetical protein